MSFNFRDVNNIGIYDEGSTLKLHDGKTGNLMDFHWCNSGCLEIGVALKGSENYEEFFIPREVVLEIASRRLETIRDRYCLERQEGV